MSYANENIRAKGERERARHTTQTTPHRESAYRNTVPISDYERVCTENAALRAELAAHKTSAARFDKVWNAVRAIAHYGLMGVGVFFLIALSCYLITKVAS